MNPVAYINFNRYGKGFRIRNGAATTFEERILFLRESSSYEADEKTPTPRVEASRSAEAENSSSSPASAIKRKVDENDEDDETEETVSSMKRIKNESSNANSISEEEGQTSVEESLFCNDLLLRTIFANLSVEDLKCCRQVNSLWNLEATKILLRCDCLAAIQILNNSVTIYDTAEYKLPTPLQDFRNIITNSKLFPISSFAVDHNKLDNDTVNFYRENGHLVKTFCFDPEERGFEMEDNDATPGDILLLVAACLPNLTKVKFVGVYEDSSPALTLLAIEKCPDLLNLHTLEITGFYPQDVIALILKKARNLQNIYLHPDEKYPFDYSRDLQTLMELGNVIPHLRNFHFLFEDDSLEVFQDVLKQNPKFASIGSIAIDYFPNFYPENVDPANTVPVVTAMFRQCSESLTELVGIKCLQDMPGLSFPVFPNVKRLEIELECVPSLDDFAQIFPNLKTFEVACSDGYHLVDALSESLSQLLSVRHLEVKWGKGHIPKYWMKKFSFLFPNVTSAKFWNPIWESAYKYLWKLSALEDLQLEVRTAARITCFVLDSAFTGFSIDTTQNLYQIDAADLNLSAEEIKSLRVKPSIVDLKELKKLSLHLFGTDIRNAHVFPDTIITKDTFGQENLQVTFDACDGKALLQVQDEIILSYISKRFGFDLCTRLNSNVSVGYTYYTKLDTDDETSDSE